MVIRPTMQQNKIGLIAHRFSEHSIRLSDRQLEYSVTRGRLHLGVFGAVVLADESPDQNHIPRSED